MGANRYAVGGRTTATAATADNVAAALWNPSGSKSIEVVEVHLTKITATADNHSLIRTSTRGTQSTTVTPDADNAYNRQVTPASGAVLDVAYSAQPTVQGPALARQNLPAAVGAGFMWVFDRPIIVPAGTGLAIAVPTGLSVAIVASDVTFVWDE